MAVVCVWEIVLILFFISLFYHANDNCKAYAMTMTSTTASNSKTRMLVDIGINLTHKQFNRDREEVIARAIERKVGALILTGTSVRGSMEAQAYCAHAALKSPNMQLFSTAGVHPHDAKSCNEETIAALKRLAQTPEVVAIGECGLDYNRNFSPPDVQRLWFERQLQLACDLQMPVFLHDREAHEDFMGIMKKYSDKLPASVVHCFTGTQEELEAYLSISNCYIGITGWVCDERRGKHLRKLVSLIPDDKIMIETDGPFLFPRDLPEERRASKKDRRNEPAFLDHICESVAACRGQTAEHVAKITTENAIRFFRLPFGEVSEN